MRPQSGFSFLPFQRLYRRHRDGSTAQRLGQARLHPGYRRLASHVLFPQYLSVGFSTPEGGAGIPSRWRLTTTLCVCCSSSTTGNLLSYRSELISIREFHALYPVFSKISYLSSDIRVSFLSCFPKICFVTSHVFRKLCSLYPIFSWRLDPDTCSLTLDVSFGQFGSSYAMSLENWICH